MTQPILRFPVTYPANKQDVLDFAMPPLPGGKKDTLPLFPAGKSTLMRLRADLYAKDNDRAKSRLTDVSFHNKEAREAVYESLYIAMGRFKPNIYYGSQAFYDNLTSGPVPKIEDKLQAVDAVAESMIRRHPYVPPVPSLAEGKQIQQRGYYARGFDFRFTFDGEYLKPLSRSVTKAFNYAVFCIVALFTRNSERKNILKLVTYCASSESALSSYCQKAFIDKSFKDLYRIPKAEQDFFEYTGELFKRLFPKKDGEAAYQQRIFPSELLRPIHMIDPKADPLPGTVILELNQIQDWTFTRLNGDLYNSKNIDAWGYDYVPHDVFIQATRLAADELKIEVAKFRQVLQETVTDWKCATSYEACMAKLTPVLQQMQQKWSNYAQSHELLREANRDCEVRVKQPGVELTPIPYLTSERFNPHEAYQARPAGSVDVAGQKTVKFLEKLATA